MGLGPEGLIGTVLRFMDDVLGICAVGNSAEGQLVKVRVLWWDSSGLTPTTGAQITWPGSSLHPCIVS